MRTIVHVILCLVFSQLVADAAEQSNAPVVITAPARLEQRGDWIYLTISDARHSYDLPWAMPPHYAGSVALESNRVYTFTIIEEPSRSGFLLSDVVRVERDGKMIYDREICEVHHIKMDRKEVRIAYGLLVPGPGEPTGDIEQRLFPHRYEVAFGGCVVSPNSPKTDKVYVCSECKKAYEKWKSKNKKTK
jgi:hypothetical protein